MKFDDIAAPGVSLRVRAKAAGGILKPGDVRLVPTSRLRGEFDLLCVDESITVVPCAPPDVNRLTDVISTGRATLARLSDVDASGGALLTVLAFSGEELTMGDVEVGIDEQVMTRVGAQSLDEAARTLLRKSVLPHGGKSYFVLVAGGASEQYLKGGESKRRFAILGSDIQYALTERNKGNGETVFLVSGITKIRNRNEDPALRLACGNLKFVDWTKAGQRAILAKAQLDAILQSGGSYLKRWDEFGKVEGDLFLERARAVGKVTFEVVDENRADAAGAEGEGTVCIRCNGLTETQKEALSNLTEIDIVDDGDLPPYLDNPLLTFEEYSNGVVEKEKASEFLGEQKLGRKKEEKKRLRTLKVAKKFNKATGEMELETSDAPAGKWLIYSVAGEVAQMTRRAKARTAILNGRAANPDLGLLIEEAGRLPPSRRPPKMKDLTAFAAQKVFPKHPPTDTQRKAIEIALNTPDIALIQGPPGTGKTTVIAAIIERLNEECDKREGISGRVLLSGFQHDAVENMIDRLRVNGLPVPKFGQRSGATRNADLMHFEDELQKWCEERAGSLRKRNPQIAESIEEQGIRSLIVQYVKAPTHSLAMNFLDAALKLPVRVLDETLVKALQLERRRLEAERENMRPENPKLAVVRGLRVTEVGFRDDGPERAADALFQLKDELGDSERELLEQASRWSAKDGAPVFLGELRRLKGVLLERYTPIPVFRTEKVRDSVVELAQKVLTCLRVNGVSARDKRTEALAELLQELENNPTGVIDAVRDYSFAFAATCQQSVNGMMREMKGVNVDEPSAKLEYDFVIIDEAARVSPRDLMVPMSQGKRIILVGDHRQLPQLIDEDVAARMEAGTDSDSEEAEWHKKSMFEYLFTERIPKLEASDDICRHVTLDRQYRMHPLLGDFISRNFYERFGEEKIKPGLGADAFIHGLPGAEGKCAAWLDVPREGRHQKVARHSGDMVEKGTSWTRPAEAAAIRDQLEIWVEHDTQRVIEGVRRWVESMLNGAPIVSGGSLVSYNIPIAKFSGKSFEVVMSSDLKAPGPISIVQNELRECIPSAMLMEVERIDADGAKTEITPLSFGVIAFYKAQSDAIIARLGTEWMESVGEDRLKIGTVDSFQGREFDVVFLSLVRTANKGFGFLKLYNRLNVSMSRQKKLLVAVGDAASYDTDAARSKVPGLADFLKLCREEGCML